MSGIIGIVNLDGSTVDCQLVLKLTEFLTVRGPDGHRIWTKSNVGFGHTLFKTTEESERDSQPLTLDGKSWIIADARVDARDELAAELKSAGRAEMAFSGCTDAELILRAYQGWGEKCVRHLLGDFAFGIWDETRRQLFCARDHMGVKPFYYAQVDSTLIFSNTLDCVRQHPRVSNILNDLAIADFLLFGLNQDSATTDFAEIHRIPPAHCVTWSSRGSSVRRYWSMPVEEPLFYKRTADYTDHFHDLRVRCVKDRLRTSRVSIFMSGGIDSPTLAATAQELLSKQYASCGLRALTKIDSFVPEEERYAQAVASRLRVPIVFRRWTEDTDPNWEQIPFSTPTPVPHAWVVPAENALRQEADAYSRVAFYGEGPDNALHCDWAPYVSGLIARRNYILLLGSVLATVISESCPPFWGRIANHFSGSDLTNSGGSDYGEWLNPDLESRLGLRERWGGRRVGQARLHPWRPHAYESFQSPLWPAMFENFDMGATGACSEMRYPFLDIRMLCFLFRVPALPWCRSKRLLRVAMQGRLPDEVLRRRKRGINQTLIFKYLENFCRPTLRPIADLGKYVNADRLPPARSANATEINMRIRALNHWLQHSQSRPHNINGEGACDRFAWQARPR